MDQVQFRKQVSFFLSRKPRCKQFKKMLSIPKRFEPNNII